MTTEDIPPLDATGERLVPDQQHGELAHAEHLARYRLALQLAGSRRVLDVACGAGYGTALLAGAAEHAVGVDVDEAAVAYASSRYRQPQFIAGDIAALPFEAGTFDLVVSFETIEHVEAPERALEELRRVLADDGLLIVSTPNKHQYLVANEFHEREFTHEQFVALLKTAFPAVEVLLQHNWVASAILDPEAAADARGERRHEVDFHKVAGVSPGGELYTIAVCGAEPARVALRGVMVAAAVDESHELARRLGEAERTAEQWHAEYTRAERVAQDWHAEFDKARAALEVANATLNAIYDSPSWWITRPLRLAKRLVRRRGG